MDGLRRGDLGAVAISAIYGAFLAAFGRDGGAYASPFFLAVALVAAGISMLGFSDRKHLGRRRLAADTSDRTADRFGDDLRSEVLALRLEIRRALRRQTWLLGAVLLFGMTALAVVFGLLARS